MAEESKVSGTGDGSVKVGGTEVPLVANAGTTGDVVKKAGKIAGLWTGVLAALSVISALDPHIISQITGFLPPVVGVPVAGVLIGIITAGAYIRAAKSDTPGTPAHITADRKKALEAAGFEVRMTK